MGPQRLVNSTHYLTHGKTEAPRSLTSSRSHNLVNVKIQSKEIVSSWKSNANIINIDEIKSWAPKWYLGPRKWFIYFKLYWYSLTLIQHKITGFLIGNYHFWPVSDGVVDRIIAPKDVYILKQGSVKILPYIEKGTV